MSKALIVNLYAGPGSLKSTIAAGVFTLLKLHGVDCELPFEFPKDLVWEENLSMLKDQHYVFGVQSHRIWRIRNKVDVVLVDSPMLFSIVYRPETLGLEFINDVVTTYKKYNNLDIFLKRNMDIKYIENGREQNFKEAIEVDNKVLKVLDTYGTPYLTMNVGFNTINEIAELILTRLKLKLRYEVNELPRRINYGSKK